MPEDPTVLAGIIVVLLLSLSWHEAAHAWVADRLGDPTARQLGRVTLNPIKHMDPILSVLLPGLLIFSGSPFIVGGGKPVPVNPSYFEKPARDFMYVALAGPFSNLLLAAAFCVIWAVSYWSGVMPPDEVPTLGGLRTLAPTLLGNPESVAAAWLQAGILLNVFLAIFNLVPLPPLDGSRLVGWILPDGLRRYWYGLDRIGLILVVAFVFFFNGIDYIRWVAMAVFQEYARAADWLTQLKDAM